MNTFAAMLAVFVLANSVVFLRRIVAKFRDSCTRLELQTLTSQTGLASKGTELLNIDAINFEQVFLAVFLVFRAFERSIKTCFFLVF